MSPAPAAVGPVLWAFQASEVLGKDRRGGVALILALGMGWDPRIRS